MTDTQVTPPSEAPAETRWWQRVEVRGIFWLWLVFTVAGLALSWAPAWLMGISASVQMDEIKQTMTIFTALSAPVAALIWAAMLYSILKWRHKGDEPPPDDGPGFRTNVPSVLAWTIASAILVLFVFVWGLLKIASVPVASAATDSNGVVSAPMTVVVTGQQWVWNFTYPGFGNIQSNELVLPIDKQTDFQVSSTDVIHSFWIVEMGVKVDANAGVITSTEVTPTRLGSYEVRCAELCGMLHAAMETHARVVSEEEFKVWIAQKQAEANSQIEPPAPEGAQ